MTLTSPETVELVLEKKVGLGQLFRYLDVLPTFTLLAVGRGPDGACWREYTLEARGIHCRIRETFSANLFGEPCSSGAGAGGQGLDVDGVNQTALYHQSV